MMRALDPGHLYELDHLDGEKAQQLQFVRRAKFNGGDDIEGVTNQEVIRALIDRIKFLDQQKPHPNNKPILFHLRYALLLHETRAMEQKMLKGELQPEFVTVNIDGHFKLEAFNGK